jgi:hypothetical protein
VVGVGVHPHNPGLDPLSGASFFILQCHLVPSMLVKFLLFF